LHVATSVSPRHEVSGGGKIAALQLPTWEPWSHVWRPVAHAHCGTPSEPAALAGNMQHVPSPGPAVVVAFGKQVAPIVWLAPWNASGPTEQTHPS
jgi:hypothetical protein